MATPVPPTEIAIPAEVIIQVLYTALFLVVATLIAVVTWIFIDLRTQLGRFRDEMEKLRGSLSNDIKELREHLRNDIKELREQIYRLLSSKERGS